MGRNMKQASLCTHDIKMKLKKVNEIDIKSVETSLALN